MTARLLTAGVVSLAVAAMLTWLALRALRTGQIQRAGIVFQRSERPIWFFFLLVCIIVAASILYICAGRFAIKALL